MRCFYFAGTCESVDRANLPFHSLMLEKGKSISYETFLKHTPELPRIAKQLGYDRRWLSMKKDWHIGYYRSVWKDTPCYFFVHSAFEYIFTVDGCL